MALRTVGVRLAAEVSGYINSLRAAKNATKDFTAELDRAAKAGKLDAVADSAARAGLVLSGAFVGVTAVAARFEKAMSSVDAATHATGEELQRLSDAALQAGKDTAFSATQAAQGIEELAKAGIATADILGGGLKGALDLAAAGQIEVGEAAETAASAMTQFQLSGRDVPHIADLLAAGAGKAQGSVRDMAQALNQTGLVAAQMGLSIEETTGTLAAFASAGLLGSDAGTSFKTMLLRLAAPTDVATAKMKELGIKAFDAQGEFVGMAKFAGNLQTALTGLTDEQRNAALSIIFGADAIRSSAIVYQQGRAGVEGWIDKTNDAGFAADTAARKTDNLMGDIERLTGSLETLAIESGGANTGVRTLVKGADSLVESISDLPDWLATTAVVMAGVGGSALLAGAGFVKVKSTAGDVLTALRDMGPTGTKAAEGLGKIGAVAGRATVWGLAIFGVYEASKLFVEFLARNTQPAKRSVDEMTESLRKLADTGKVTGEMAKAFGPNWEHLRSQIEALNVAAAKLPKGLTESGNALGELGRGMVDTGRQAAGLNDEISKAANQSRENFSAVDQALKGLVDAGGVTQAKLAFEELAARWVAAGLPLERLRELLPEYTKAAAGAAAASSATAKGFGTAEQNARTMTRGLQAAIDAGQTLIDVMDQLTGAAVGWARAEIDLEDAIDDATKTIGENGKTLDANSEAGRENRQSLLDIRDATVKATQSKYDETQSVEEARKVYEKGRKALVDSAMQAGKTRAEAEKLADQWLKMPPMVATQVNTPGLDAAINGIKRLGKAIFELPSGVNFAPRGTIGLNRHGGVWQHAQAGLLSEAAVFSPRSPARFAFAEPATGGEAFVPKFGDRSRSLAILDQAAGWHKAMVVPWEQMANGMSAGGDTHVYVTIDGQQLEGRITRVVREHDRGVRRRAMAGRR